MFYVNGSARIRFFFLSFLAAVSVAIFLMAGVCAGASAKQAKQMTFASPEEAVKALIAATKTHNKKQLRAIFGPTSYQLVSSGDETADRGGREQFIKSYEEKNKIVQETPDKAVLFVGTKDWPFPISIVKKKDTWVFDTKAGKEEMVNRRIGHNELNVMEVMHAYVEAQRDYASKDRDGDGILEYAQKLVSDEGKQDGLYWDSQEGAEESPFGPLVANAAKEGYQKKAVDSTPFRGYYYKVLTAQGANAPGGEYSYIVKGNMVLGFALVAWPARYLSTGVMTFIVNQQGIIYEKDLGKDTAKVAGAMTKYDPDSTWKKAEEPQKK
jgi:hypothetical protein